MSAQEPPQGRRFPIEAGDSPGLAAAPESQDNPETVATEHNPVRDRFTSEIHVTVLGTGDPREFRIGAKEGKENGHVKSNGDLSPKGEGESPPVNGTDEAAGATGDAIEPAPPSQGAEAKGEAPPKETPKKKKKFSFKKPFKLSGLSFKRNRKEGGGDSSASSPTEEEQEQGEIGACSEEGTAQEGKAADTPESQEPQAKGAEASAAAKGGDAEEEAGPQAAEPSTPSGPESEPAPASASAEQNE
ncbi:MARCKS-related protein [Fukomys damarensis]|uniref:MARCKS-related protein n=1 Tax=Fukomys damarensis TaxID=885580 RepID=A0A091DV99_FUKDA|nr:MARCKS-related protein [Fukomys damarensis]